ncbi:MAG TPA: gliding motility-associated protein GldE [Fermentimonas sp.]|nr:gliding motility-associated protein GldE [Fermentimonas sp.]
MDPDPLSYLALSDYALILFLIVLIIINAIVSGSVVAFFSIGKNLPDNLGISDDMKKFRVLNILKKPEKLQASLILTYHLVNVTVTALTIYLLNKLPFFSSNSGTTIILEVLIAISIILLFIEILPKRVATKNPLQYAINNISIIRAINKIMSPFSVILTLNGILKQNRSQEYSIDQLRDELSETEELSREQEKEMLEGIIRFRDKNVDDIKVSRSDMIAINIQSPFSEVIEFIVDAGYSRIPAYDENPDNIQGILYVKDLLPHIGKSHNFKWQSIIRSAYFVPGTKRIDDLLEEFRTNKIHMAIVVDEYGGTSGLITMEDILEEIVGDISDEYDEEFPLYSMAADGSFIFEGKTPIEDFIKITNVPEKDFELMNDEVDTLAGLLLELKGDFPKRKESFTYKKYKFQAEEMSKKRILKVRYFPI